MKTTRVLVSRDVAVRLKYFSKLAKSIGYFSLQESCRVIQEMESKVKQLTKELSKANDEKAVSKIYCTYYYVQLTDVGDMYWFCKAVHCRTRVFTESECENKSNKCNHTIGPKRKNIRAARAART